MTEQESFKRRVRERMATTGERYAAARRSLIDRSGPTTEGRTWVSEPEHSDEVIQANTGRSWNQWCDLIDAWPGRSGGHPAIATHLREAEGLDGWWAQAVTCGHERITGLRLPNQRMDGTFTAGKSKTITADAEGLRSLLLGDDRDELFGGLRAELRSKPTSKSIRLAIGPGVALITIEPMANGRAKVIVDHEKLPAATDVPEWKFFWGEWLESLDEG